MCKQFKYVLMLVCAFGLLLEAHTQDPADIDSIESIFEMYDSVAETKTDNLLSKDLSVIEKVQPVLEKNINKEKLEKIRKDEDYWYANKNFRKETKTAATSPQRNWMDILFWILLIGGVVALIIWFFVSGNMRLFRRKSAAVANDEAIQDNENIYELDFEKEISKAVNENNFRLATRMLYLQLLRNLADRELIQYSHEKTNRNYLFQLSGTSHYKDFFRLTRHFEYVWYGKFSLSKDQFELVQTDFSNYKSRLH